jgi:hypothetical protein
MDPDFAQENHSGAYPRTGAAPPSVPERSFSAPYTQVPEDVDGALRYTPLTSVVPMSGGTSYPLNNTDTVSSVECIASGTVFLLLSNSIDDES